MAGVGITNPVTFGVARVVELVDTRDLKSLGHCGRAGSIPVPGTIKQKSGFSFIWVPLFDL